MLPSILVFASSVGYNNKQKHSLLKEVTTDTPGLTQFKLKSRFVIQTAWVWWCSG